MDGVMYHGNKLLDGAKEFIQWLQQEGKNFLFLTNASVYTPKELQEKLRRLGLEVCNVLVRSFTFLSLC
jgi:NagD protein